MRDTVSRWAFMKHQIHGADIFAIDCNPLNQADKIHRTKAVYLRGVSVVEPRRHQMFMCS